MIMIPNTPPPLYGCPEFHSAKTLDIPYARKVLEHLVAHPEEHSQKSWAIMTPCKTTSCIAGTTVLMDPESSIIWDSISGEMKGAEVDGEFIAISTRSSKLLGLNDSDANRLFYNGSNEAALKWLELYISEAEKVQH